MDCFYFLLFFKWLLNILSTILYRVFLELPIAVFSHVIKLLSNSFSCYGSLHFSKMILVYFLAVDSVLSDLCIFEHNLCLFKIKLLISIT